MTTHTFATSGAIRTTGALAWLWCLLVCMSSAAGQEQRTLTRQVLRDKIRGGWAGQMIGVAYGAPTEFQWRGRIIEDDLDWQPGMLENTIHQDDLYVEMTFAKVMDDVGLDATCEQFGEAFKGSQYHVWHANAGARRVLNQGINAPWSGHPKYNFHANDIDFQIEADFIGLMCPGLPHESNRFCDRVGHVMNYGDGVYGGMFVCGMYAAAYLQDDPREVVTAGWRCIPPGSQYGQLIEDLLDWSAQYPDDWRKVWHLVQDKWDVDDPCPDGFQADFNIDAKLNGAYVAFGLLFGGGDFERTLEISTRCGQDSDCNPSSAGGVLGVMLGFDRIPQKFVEELPSLENRKFDFTDYSFNEIVASTEKRALQVIERAGGRVTDADVTIRVQAPEPPELEQWTPGIPDRRIGVDETVWSWSGPWAQDGQLKVAKQAGCEATLQFSGVAVAIIGRLNQSGGRADVFLDGQKQELGLDAYIVPNTHDNVLWQAYGLEPGEHTLRIATSGQADARSNGREIAISQALVYQAARTQDHPDSTAWDPLFAADLSDAQFPAGVWSFTGGVLTATEDQCIWTKKTYADCIVDLEFKTDEGTNSGVFVYCSDTDAFIPNSVEIQIADDFAPQWANSPKTWQCGAIFGHLAARASVVKRPGQWNRMTITCRGPIISVLLNGQQVTEIDLRRWTSATRNPDGSEIPAWLSRPLAELPTRGHVGLQGKHAGAPIYFRNLRIKTLP